MFKNHKVVANALRGTNPSEPNSLQNSIKFFMKNLDTMIQVKVYPTHVRQKDCALLLFLDRNERNAPLLGAFGGEENNTHYLFLASLSHELRTPLNSALALIQSSVQELTIPEEVKEKLLIPALTSIQILSYNIKDIIDYSKMSYGALGLRLETCNVPALVERIMKLVEIQAKKKKISILSKIDPDVPLEWCTDPERVCQTILNLLSNGLKYTLKGSIVVCVKYMKKQGLIKVKVSDTGLGIESSELVKLQKNLKDQELFSKKINLHSTGIGLGLSVSNHICAALGPSKYDYLRVKSVFNKGSEFTFYIENKTKAQIMSVESPGTIETHESLLTDASNFRLKGNFTKTNHKYATRKGSIFSPFRSGKTMKDFPSKEPEISDGKLEESSDDSSDSSPSLYANTTLLTHQYLSFESTKNKLTLNTENPVRQHSPLLREVKIFNEGKAKNSRINRVLIVDDDSFNILSLELIFKKLRIPHDHAYNGKEAIEKVLANKYDLIMMDCNMPVMDGWEATKHILKLISEGKVKNLVIVACTAFEDAENLMKCVDAGMKYIIQKPVNIDKLSDLLKKFISD